MKACVWFLKLSRPIALSGLMLGGLLAQSNGTVSAQTTEPQSASSQDACRGGCITTTEAVTFASYVGSKAGITGRFEMPVRAVGKRNGRFFLNSEQDYRDRNCLTVVIDAATMRQLIGSESEELARRHFIDKQIVVWGTARERRIDFLAPGGQPTGSYYFQVHVQLQEPHHLIAGL